MKTSDREDAWLVFKILAEPTPVGGFPVEKLQFWGRSGYNSQKIKKNPNHDSRKIRQRLQIGN
jgi:hypothetical protein